MVDNLKVVNLNKIVFLIFLIMFIGGVFGNSSLLTMRLKYSLVVNSGYYINSHVNVSNGSFSYLYMLIVARNQDSNVRLVDLLDNKTAACSIYGNSSAVLDVTIRDNKVDLVLTLVNVLLICNVKPWFNVEGDVSLSKIQYDLSNANKQEAKIYAGRAARVLLKSSLLFNNTSWSILRGNNYIGDMIFFLRDIELYQNATLLLYRHTGDVELKFGDKVYPTALVAFVNYTNHPLGLNEFSYNDVNISSSDLCVAEFSKPAIGIVKMINPPVDLLNHWRKIVHKHNLLLVDLQNNTYIVKNYIIEQVYRAINSNRLWRLNYYLVSSSRIDDTEFYRYYPFTIINNTPYGIVPPTSNITTMYDNINGVLVLVNISNNLKPSAIIREYMWYPIDILRFGFNISMIVFPRNSTLSMKLIDATINKAQLTVIGSPVLNKASKEMVKPLFITLILSVILLLIIFIKYKEAMKYK